jgi:tungstate transport system ATP-binding protein
MSELLYRLRGVEASYGVDGGASVLHVPELDIPYGASIGLFGHNGSGKSTLLKLLGFLLAPSAGELYFEGRRVDAAAMRHGHLLRRRAVLLGQDTCLLKRSVAANVAYGLKLRGESVGGTEGEARIARAMALAGLDYAAYARRSWRQLSGGEARRVALAARLALEPAALLLDEPTTGLDRDSTEHVKAAVLAARERGAALVLASHDQAWLKACAQTVLTLEDGRIVATS